MPRTAHFSARLAASLVPFVLALTLAPAAYAVDAKVESEAKKAATDAMDNDYLALDLKKAKAKLLKALERCGDAKCSASTLGLLHRDLGVVLATAKDAKGADAEFDAALQADPKGEVPKDYLSNAEVKKAWEAAKKRAKPAAKSTPAPADDAGGVSVKFTTAPVGYEFPIVVSAPKGAASVKVSFKTDAMDKYRSLDAEKQGKAWVAILPCAHTAAAGEIKYFVKVFDGDGNEVDHKGSVKSPETLSIVATMPDGEETPSLPGDKEPKQCGEQGDKKPEGAGCGADDECQDGLVCTEGDEGKKRCEAGERKTKKASSGSTPRFFLGVEGQIELMSIGLTTNLCNQSGWACSADQVGGGVSGRVDVGPGDPNSTINLTNGGRTEGGTSVATARALVSADYFVSPRLAIGARVGYAFNGNPTKSHPFSPIHAEARIHYFFNEATVRPFLGLGLGYGEIDGKITGVIVTPTDPTYATMHSSASNTDVIDKVNAYRTAGAGFVSVGTGAWFFLGSNVALNLGFKVILPLPTFSMVFAPEAGLKVGF